MAKKEPSRMESITVKIYKNRRVKKENIAYWNKNVEERNSQRMTKTSQN